MPSDPGFVYERLGYRTSGPFDARSAGRMAVMLFDPRAEGANPGGLATRIKLFQKPLQLPEIEERKPAAGALLDVGAVGLKLVRPERLSIVDPHFGHPDVRINA